MSDTLGQIREDERRRPGANRGEWADRRFALAVLIPCRDEEAGIANVVESFREALPAARLYVYDNASRDRTATAARAAGAEVRFEPSAGKGNVVRRMFADVEADIYVLADGDGACDAKSAPAMVARLVADNLDLVVARRVETAGRQAYRPLHKFGNACFNHLTRALFGGQLTDTLSGYRVMSRRFVKTMPVASEAFEIESEMSIHCLQMGFPYAEVPTRFTGELRGSVSKLRTWRDGLRILFAIGRLKRDIHPFRFFFCVGAGLAALAIGLAIPVFATYLETGLVPRLPTAVLCLGLGTAAYGSFLAGVILDSLSRERYELKRLAYLGQPSLRESGASLSRQPTQGSEDAASESDTASSG